MPPRRTPKAKATPKTKLSKKTKPQQVVAGAEVPHLAIEDQEVQQPAADVDQGAGGGGARPSMARSHSELAGTRNLGALMPAVNAELHAAIEQDINTIMEHPIFSGIRFCQPLQIDENATEAECGYKALHAQLPQSVALNGCASHSDDSGPN